MRKIIKEHQKEVIEFECKTCLEVWETDEWTYHEVVYGDYVVSECKQKCGSTLSFPPKRLLIISHL